MVSKLLAALVASGFLIAGCRSGNDGNGFGNVPPPRGTLLSDPHLLATYSVADLLAALGQNDLGKQLLALAYAPVCAVNVYQVKYETAGGRGEAATASGALMIPIGTNSACLGSRPIVLYAHGTSPDKTYNIADITKPDAGEGLLLTAVFAATGYIVVAPNYAGYDTSDLPYHPYLVANQQGGEMIDILTAARSAFPIPTAPATTDSQKLFITGYSQGGFVAMAAHKAMQAQGLSVTAAAPMSGPYAVAASGDAIFMGRVTTGPTVNLTLLLTGYQQTYGNVYSSPTDVFEAAYAPDITSLLPSTTAVSTLYGENKLPQNQLFNSTPPAPEFASITPATTPASIAPIFALGFGPHNLITNAYRLEYLRDEQASPDGGFPIVTTGLPAPSPNLALREDLKQNDQRDWVPTAPVLLCGGDNDPTVLYLNTQLMQDYWTANPPTQGLTVLDVDAGVTAGDPYATLKRGFAAAKAAVAANAVLGGATDGGAIAVLQAYHAALVPPFCLSAVKSFFDGF